MLVKFTVLVLLAIVCVWHWSTRAVSRGRVELPWSLSAAVAVAFLGVALLATIVSVRPLLSLIGETGRYSGLLSYSSYVVMFLAVLASAGRGSLRLWARALLCAGGVVVLLGLAQAGGADPFGFMDSGLPGAFSTFGNVNFAGAWVGAVLALALTSAISRSETRIWRLGAVWVLAGGLLYAVLTTTSQALVVSAIALMWAASVRAAASVGLRDWVRTNKLSVFGLICLVLGAVTVIVWTVRERIAAAFAQALVERPYFWTAAWEIWQDHPLIGTGLDTYGQFFLAYRPEAHALVEGAGTADAPHSVPLAMLASGGLLLALVYLAFVLLTGVALIRGVVKGDDSTRIALAGWGGVWLGYQAQSLVSFDVPPLALLHFVSAGVIVSLGWPPMWREVRLPGLAAGKAWNSRRMAGAAPKSRNVVRIALAIVAVMAAWFALFPLRADIVAASAEPLVSQGRYAEAFTRFKHAAALNPAEAEYSMLAARALLASGRPKASLEFVEEAAARAPGEVEYPVFAARIASEMGKQNLAERWYREAVSRDPNGVDVLTEAAGFWLEHGEPRQARRFVLAALSVDSDNPTARQQLRRLEG